MRRENYGLALTLSDFGTVRARAIVLASGVSYRLLGIPALEELNGAGVFYGGPTSEAPAMADRDVYILGGANSAGQAPCIWHVMQRTSPWSCEPTRWPLVCPTI